VSFLKTSGGFYHDCLIHDLDLITWLLGEFPEEVYSAGTTHIPEIAALNDHDTVAATLRLKLKLLKTSKTYD